MLNPAAGLGLTDGEAATFDTNDAVGRDADSTGGDAPDAAPGAVPGAGADAPGAGSFPGR